MKYTLRYTGEFKRSLKRCLKRGYDERLLTDVLDIAVCQRSITRISYMDSTKAIGNVTSLQTGSSSGTKTTVNWCC